MKIFRTGAYENFYDMPLAVNWSITEKCNYCCSYCFISGAKASVKNDVKSKPFTTLEQIQNAVKNIVSLNRPWYNVTFVGGEPTIHPHLFDVIALLHENLQERLNNVVIISNGSRNKNLYENIAKVSKSLSIQLIISIHTDHVEMDHILELIENLSNDVRLTFALMFNPAKREMVKSIYKTLFEYRKNFPFTLNINFIMDKDHIDARHTEEDFAWQRKATADFRDLVNQTDVTFSPTVTPKHTRNIFCDFENDGNREVVIGMNRAEKLSRGLSVYKDMYCVSNAAMLRIEEDGRCLGMVCWADKILCNIFEENSLFENREKLIHAVKCPLQTCGCVSNHCIPKFSSKEEADIFVEIFKEKQLRLFNKK